MKNKNILVFGSTGFIGRSLSKRLLQSGYKLICPVRNASRIKRNILSGDIGQIEVIEFDINNLNEIENLVKKKQAIYDLRVDKRINKVGKGVILENFNIEKLPNYIQKNLSKYNEWMD